MTVCPKTPRKALLRKSPIKRGSAMKPKKRSAKEKLRIYGAAERITWLKKQPCLLVGRGTTKEHGPHQCFGAIQVAHIMTGGMGRKANAEFTVPLCHAAHHTLHTIGQRSFERTYGLV